MMPLGRPGGCVAACPHPEEVQPWKTTPRHACLPAPRGGGGGSRVVRAPALQ
jgi:hypothetical protein